MQSTLVFNSGESSNKRPFAVGDEAGAAMCARILDEYAQLTAEAAGRVCRAAASESFIKGLTDAALV